MAGVEFADFGNALLAGSQGAYSQGRGRREAEAEARRKEAQPFIEPAVRGDPGAFAKVAAGDPATAASVAQALARMDASTLAKAKQATDYTTNVTTGLLAAPPGDRERLYQQTRADAQAKGMDVSRWPANYDPAWVQMQHGIGIGAKSWFEQSQQNARATAGPSQVDMPSGGGSPYGRAIGGIESSGQPNGGYGAVGPPADAKGSRAYGKYQVMDFNIGPWTQEILGKAMTPQEFAANPQAQDAVFNGKFGQYMKQYGSPQAAARAWFAGERGMNNPGATDVNGMSVANYERKFTQGLPPAAMPAPPSGMAQATPPAQMPGPPSSMAQSGRPVPLPQVGGPPAPGMPGPIAQGDTPQADGSGTPLPPQAGPGKPQGPVWDTDPRPFGYVMRGERDKFGNVKPIAVGGALLFRNPQTNEHVLYQPRPAPQIPQSYRWANGQEGGTLEPIPGGPADPTTQRRERVPPGYRMKDSGEGLEFIPGGPADPSITKRSAPMNNEQARDAGFADRMTNSNALLSTLDTQGTDTWGRLTEMAGKTGNYAQNPQYQEFRQAKADFINAQLRRESGAAIGPDEFKKADEQYFPQPGDKPGVIAQKARNRQLAVEGMIRGAGPSYQPSPSVNAGPPNGAPAAASPPPSLKLPPKDGGETAGAIPRAAVDRLKANPGERAQFDEIFGAGAAAKVLGR